MCAGDVALTQSRSAPPPSPCARLSRAPSTISGSDFQHGVCLPQDGPFVRHTRPRLRPTKTMRGSPRFLDASVSGRAVLSDPAAVSDHLASSGGLLLPSRFSTLSACGSSSHEAQSLHLRYGPSLALPTLSPCRYLHEPKARFPVGRLIPLAGAGIAPAGSARLTPGAPKKALMSRSMTQSNTQHLFRATPTASSADRPGR